MASVVRVRVAFGEGVADLTARGWREVRPGAPLERLVREHDPIADPLPFGEHAPYALLAIAERAAQALGGRVLEVHPALAALERDLAPGAIL